MEEERTRSLWQRRTARAGTALAAVFGLALAAGLFGWPRAAFLTLAAAGALAAWLYFFLVRAARIPRKAVLVVRLAGQVREHAPAPLPWSLMRERTGPSLDQLRRIARAGASDPRLWAVVVQIGGLEAGLATAQEIGEALATLRRAGKRVVALLAGDSVGVRDYLAACGAGEIVVGPNTLLALGGVSAGSIFLKAALEKAGLQAQTLQWKEYKGAAEMLARDAMSAPLRESLQALVADLRGAIVAAAAPGRRIEPQRLEKLLGSGFLGPADAVAAGLADRLGCYEEVLRELAGNDQGRRVIGVGRYLRRLAALRPAGRKPRLALIYGVGPVLAGERPAAGQVLAGESVAALVRRASRSAGVRAIVLRINSPGGSAHGSEVVWNAVAEARRRGRPVVVSMGDVAASGGYYIASGADAIVAQPTTVTGSIGVVYAKLSAGGLLARLGIGFEAVKTDPAADALSLARPLNEQELGQLDRAMAAVYRNFVARVAEGRAMSVERVEELARGRVWSGLAAFSHGLVDRLGGLDTAVALACAKAGLAADESTETVVYPAEGLLYGVASRLRPDGAGLSGWPIPEQTGWWNPSWILALAALARRGAVLMLCPWSAP